MPDAYIPTSCLQNHHQYCTILSWIHALDTVANMEKGVCKVYMPSPFYTVSVLFQQCGFVVSHMQVLATPLLSVHTPFPGSLPLKAFSFSCLFVM